MRHSPTAIRQFLIDQPVSGLTVADFCADHNLKVPTFYSWKRKHIATNEETPSGFCEITPRQATTDKILQLPSGLRIELKGLSNVEIADLILEIDRAHA